MRSFLPIAPALFIPVAIAPACQVRENCKDSDGITRMHADESFPDVEQVIIQAAAERWNDFVGRDAIEVEPLSHEAHCTLYSSPKEDIAPGVQGVYHEVNGNIEIASKVLCDGSASGREPHCLELIVLHELGHALGLEHIPDGEVGVMQRVGVANDFTEADKAECVRVGVCS